MAERLFSSPPNRSQRSLSGTQPLPSGPDSVRSYKPTPSRQGKQREHASQQAPLSQISREGRLEGSKRKGGADTTSSFSRASSPSGVPRGRVDSVSWTRGSPPSPGDLATPSEEFTRQGHQADVRPVRELPPQSRNPPQRMPTEGARQQRASWSRREAEQPNLPRPSHTPPNRVSTSVENEVERQSNTSPLDDSSTDEGRRLETDAEGQSTPMIHSVQQQADTILGSSDLAFTESDGLWHPELHQLLQEARTATAASASPTAAAPQMVRREVAPLTPLVEEAVEDLSFLENGRHCEGTGAVEPVEAADNNRGEGQKNEGRRHLPVEAEAASFADSRLARAQILGGTNGEASCCCGSG